MPARLGIRLRSTNLALWRYLKPIRKITEEIRLAGLHNLHDEDHSVVFVRAAA